MAEGSDTARNRRISFSAEPAAVVVTASAASAGGPTAEVLASATSVYGAAAAKGDVAMADLQGLLEGLGIGGAATDFVRRQKVVPAGKATISKDEFVALASAFEDFSQEEGGARASAGCPADLPASLF